MKIVTSTGNLNFGAYDLRTLVVCVKIVTSTGNLKFGHFRQESQILPASQFYPIPAQPSKSETFVVTSQIFEMFMIFFKVDKFLFSRKKVF